MTSRWLYRIKTGDYVGMTGHIVSADDTHYTVALRCQPGVTVRVPRSWIVRVPEAPETAQQARERLGAA